MYELCTRILRKRLEQILEETNQENRLASGIVIQRLIIFKQLIKDIMN